MTQYLELNQIESLRDAAHERGSRYSTELRDELLVVMLADLGLRVSELVQLKEDHLKLKQEEIVIPSEIQKSYPNGNEPRTATLRLDPFNHFGTVRLLRTYLRSPFYNENSEDYLFPSRQEDKMSKQSVRNTLKELAQEANIRPYTDEGTRADSEDINSHAFRHSVANYMLRDQENRLVDVRNRLRHRSIQTTEKVYEHFQRR